MIAEMNILEAREMQTATPEAVLEVQTLIASVASTMPAAIDTVLIKQAERFPVS